jgi:hypothetical protein
VGGGEVGRGGDGGGLRGKKSGRGKTVHCFGSCPAAAAAKKRRCSGSDTELAVK